MNSSIEIGELLGLEQVVAVQSVREVVIGQVGTEECQFASKR